MYLDRVVLKPVEPAVLDKYIPGTAGYVKSAVAGADDPPSGSDVRNKIDPFRADAAAELEQQSLPAGIQSQVLTDDSGAVLRENTGMYMLVVSEDDKIPDARRRARRQYIIGVVSNHR